MSQSFKIQAKKSSGSSTKKKTTHYYEGQSFRPKKIHGSPTKTSTLKILTLHDRIPKQTCQEKGKRGEKRKRKT